ncbi:MAG: flagellar biosynthetic protein FliQ [Ignavibacteriae bacterium HGW-Ignavibacteriae-4]|jgi:flagellar biosynthetic protein FliQ|nr:MAG: flagellar biosynthetic protein FliQ [Ignavibacteriae bacterium HGW-Ignavibacteriae-4]
MTDQMVTEIAGKAFYYIMIVSGPILLVSLVVGLIISIFQAATSISEQTLTFVPKVITVFLVTILIFPFMISSMKTFTIEMFSMIEKMGP